MWNIVDGNTQSFSVQMKTKWEEKQSLSYTEQIPSAKLRSLELHITWRGCFWLDIWKMLLCVRYWGDESKKTWCCATVCSPAATTPSSLGSNSYLVEVGGPVLSFLSLSFICELFVCSALHCHTALANLPNESQELHNNNQKKKEKKWQQNSFYYFALVRITPIWCYFFQSNVSIILN